MPWLPPAGHRPRPGSAGGRPGAAGGPCRPGDVCSHFVSGRPGPPVPPRGRTGRSASGPRGELPPAGPPPPRLHHSAGSHPRHADAPGVAGNRGGPSGQGIEGGAAAGASGRGRASSGGAGGEDRAAPRRAAAANQRRPGGRAGVGARAPGHARREGPALPGAPDGRERRDRRARGRAPRDSGRTAPRRCPGRDLVPLGGGRDREAGVPRLERPVARASSSPSGARSGAGCAGERAHQEAGHSGSPARLRAWRRAA